MLRKRGNRLAAIGPGGERCRGQPSIPQPLGGPILKVGSSKRLVAAERRPVLLGSDETLLVIGDLLAASFSTRHHQVQRPSPPKRRPYETVGEEAGGDQLRADRPQDSEDWQRRALLSPSLNQPRRLATTIGRDRDELTQQPLSFWRKRRRDQRDRSTLLGAPIIVADRKVLLLDGLPQSPSHQVPLERAELDQMGRARHRSSRLSMHPARQARPSDDPIGEQHQQCRPAQVQLRLPSNPPLDHHPHSDHTDVKPNHPGPNDRDRRYPSGAGTIRRR